MTVQTTNLSTSFTGDGVTDTFAYDFTCIDIYWVTAYVNGVEVSVQDTSINGDQDSNPGGFTTITVTPSLGDDILIVRNVDLLQTTDYPPYTRFPARSHEDALDKLTMVAQQQSGDIDTLESDKVDKTQAIIAATPSTLSIPETDLSGNVNISTITNVANGLLQLDSMGKIPPGFVDLDNTFFPGSDPDLLAFNSAIGWGSADPDTDPHIEAGPTLIQAKADGTTAANININSLGGDVVTGPTVRLLPLAGDTNSSVSLSDQLTVTYTAAPTPLLDDRAILNLDDAGGEFEFQLDGTVALSTSLLGATFYNGRFVFIDNNSIDLRSLAGATPENSIRLSEPDSPQIAARIGHISGDSALQFKSYRTGGNVTLSGTDALDAEIDFLNWVAVDTGQLTITSGTVNVIGESVTLQSNNAALTENATLNVSSNYGIDLRVDGVLRFETGAPNTGSLFVNNLATGAGMERVLTTSDLGGGGGGDMQSDGSVAMTGNLNLGAGTDELKIFFDQPYTEKSMIWGYERGLLIFPTDSSQNPSGVPWINCYSDAGGTDRFVELYTHAGASLKTLPEGVRIVDRAYVTNANTVDFDELTSKQYVDQAIATGIATKGDFFSDGSVAMTGGLEISASGDVVVAGNLVVNSSGGGIAIQSGAPGSLNAGMLCGIGAAGYCVLLEGNGTLAGLQLQSNQATLFQDGGTNCAQTLDPASGGLQVNNTLTGAGMERALTVSDLPAGSSNIYRYTTANLTATSTTTPAAIPEFDFPVDANSVYRVEGYLQHSQAGIGLGGGLKIRFESSEAGHTITSQLTTGGAAIIGSSAADLYTDSLLVNNTTLDIPVDAQGNFQAVIETDANAGTISATYAQIVSNANGDTLARLSNLRATKIS